MVKIKIVHQRNEHHVLRLHFVHLIQQNSRRLELSVCFSILRNEQEQRAICV